MPTSTDPIVIGTPRFEAADLANCESSQGPLAAWRQAFKKETTAAAAAAQGHFAVALHDGDSHHLAVDRFATESLCWRVEAGELQVARGAKELAGTQPVIDVQSLHDYLYFHQIPSPRTVYEGVHRLTAGHCARFRNGQMQVERYWAPTFAEQPVRSLHDAKHQFRRLLSDAVRAQLDGSRPAAFLSGGTDSSTVAGLIGEVSGRPAATYSIGFDADGYDEMAYARIAARRFGCEHHEYYVTPEDLVQGIPAMAAHFDQPFGNSSALPAYLCALRAREDGVTRLLAGDGGDELFGGNTRYAKQQVFAWYGDLPAAFRGAVLDPLTDKGMLDGIPLLRKASSYVRQARVGMPERLETYNLLHRLGESEMLTQDFLARVDPGNARRQQAEVWSESIGTSFVNRMLAFDWRYTLAENDLPKVRAGTSLAGISADYPFLEQAVVDFSMALPTSYKLRHLKLRWFFKEALRGFLPDEIINKKKHGFGLPFGVWALRHDGLKKIATDSLRALGARGIVRREFIETLLKHKLPEHPGYFGEAVWILMMLEQWFHHHLPDYRLDR